MIKDPEEVCFSNERNDPSCRRRRRPVWGQRSGRGRVSASFSSQIKPLLRPGSYNQIPGVPGVHVSWGAGSEVLVPVRLCCQMTAALQRQAVSSPPPSSSPHHCQCNVGTGVEHFQPLAAPPPAPARCAVC